jgi:hypothetical protein
VLLEGLDQLENPITSSGQGKHIMLLDDELLSRREILGAANDIRFILIIST